jgi:UDP-glucuronate 4-epimerase
MQPGDVQTTYADVEELVEATGVKPHTTLEQGLEQFVAWFREYHAVPVLPMPAADSEQHSPLRAGA